MQEKEPKQFNHLFLTVPFEHPHSHSALVFWLADFISESTHMQEIRESELCTGKGGNPAAASRRKKAEGLLSFVLKNTNQCENCVCKNDPKYCLRGHQFFEVFCWDKDPLDSQRSVPKKKSPSMPGPTWAPENGSCGQISTGTSGVISRIIDFSFSASSGQSPLEI